MAKSRKDTLEHGMEADPTKPLFSDESRHASREQEFALDSDAPVGGPGKHVGTVLEAVDLEERQKKEAGEDDEEPPSL